MAIISAFPSGGVNSQSEGSLTLTATSVSLDISNLSTTVTAVRSGSGAISAISSNTSVATVSVSGAYITITAVAEGSATVTVSVAETSDYTAPASQAISVTVGAIPSTTFANNTPSEIQACVQAGQAANYWSVGDKIGIALSGTVGSLSLSSTYYAFILGFDHNSTYEGTNTMHMQFGKTSGGVDIAFVDSNYGSYDTSSTTWFKMNTTNTNSGGWSSSTMRTARCSEFLSCMPSTWQSIISACTKYTDNTGGGSDTASYVTSTSDKIWLLSEYEVQGARSYANSAEQNYQAQYAYYANGNSKIKYQHSATSTACIWWLRSPFASTSTVFCYVATSGGAGGTNAYSSRGFAPGFKVA